MSGVPQRARPASAGAALDRKSRARHDGSPADDSNEERGAVRGRVALLPRSSEAQPWFRRSVTHTHHRTKRWASHAPLPPREGGATWAGPPVPRRRARAGAPLLGFGGSMWASLHNTTTQPKHTSRSWVGFAFVLCDAWHVCLSNAGRLCLSTPPYPSHSTREAGRAAPADPAPSHPAQSSLGPPLTHVKLLYTP